MIGVIGLGLIGGSMAKALNQNTEHTVYGYDIDKTVMRKAVLVNAIEEELTDDMLSDCDLTIIALYPADTVNYLKGHASSFKKGSIVMDCCGIKDILCKEAYDIAEKNGFTFIGGHPMAGMEHSGFDHAKRALFNKASMILVPAKGTAIEDVEKVKNIFESIGFSNTVITTPEEHDRMIAFTSQLAHVVSSAYIKSPTARDHLGFSAGSYKDLTRVAKLNEDMWTELFLDNRDNLTNEIDWIIEHLTQYRDAIAGSDASKLHSLLKEGRILKEDIDKEVF